MSDGLNEDWGVLGIGDLSTEGTSALSVRDATSTTTLPSNTTRIKLATTAGAYIWHGPADSNTLNWQTISFGWQSGQALTVALDGVITANNITPLAGTTATTTISGPIVIGAAGGAAAAGKWSGLVDELRIGKLLRSDAWRKLEHLSFTDQGFTTIGAEETPAGAGSEIVTVADADTTTWVTSGSVLLDVLANDTHPTGLPLFVQNPTIAGGGSCAVDSNQLRVTYPTTWASTGGNLTGTYEATDGGTLVSAGTWSLRVDPEAAPPPTGLFFNPFNRWSAHHRPIGAGYQLGIPPDTTSNTAAPTGGTPYDSTANRAAVDAAMAKIGDIILSPDGASNANVKHMHRVTTNNSYSPSRSIRWNGDGNAAGFKNASGATITRTTRVPIPGQTTPDGETVEYPTSGDGSVVLWPKDGNTAVDMIVGFNEFRYNAATSQAQARFFVEYPLAGNDWDEGDGYDIGFSAAEIRYPFGWLRGFEINPTSPSPIYHPLQAGCTRHGGEGASVVQHILSRRWCWPASNRDFDADGTRTFGTGAAAVTTPSNQGPLPYGTRIFIPPTATNKALRASAPGGARGKVLFDACMYYGIILVDGHGQLGPTSTTGRLQLRCEYTINSAARNDCNNFLGWLARQKILMPLYNVPRISAAKTAENYNNPGHPRHGEPFAGGGGPIDGNSVNNAHDLT
jgi:hypothetical protein